MSLTFEDGPVNSSEAPGSQLFSNNERRMTRGAKGKSLRLDSPTTIQACKELGIKVEDLKQKTFGDFHEANTDEDIIQIRYNHYMQRYNQYVKDVMAQKKQIIRAKARNEKVAQQLHHKQLGLDAGTSGIKSMPIFPMSARSTMNNSSMMGFSPMKQSLLGPQAILPGPMLNTYNSTMSYLRSSHNTSETKGLNDLLKNEMATHGGDEIAVKFDHALSLEVSKFNKVKRQKQKEALDTYGEEMKRIRIMEELKEKEKRNIERQKKQVVEHKKLEEEKKKKAEEKLEQLRELDKQFRIRKAEEKEKIQKKLDATKKKLEIEVEQRRRTLAEQEARLEMKRKQAEETRKRLKREEQERCDQLKDEINEKLMQKEEKHNYNLNEKTSRVKQQIQKIEESVEKMREKQQTDAKEYVQKLVEKLVEKEESLRGFQNQHLSELKKKEKELADKRKKLHENQSEKKQEERDRMKEINERFQKVKENLEAKRLQDEKDMKIRQELTKLKMKDKQENFHRKLRQTQYERQLILDKQKQNEMKIQWLKSQKDILQQAKVEVSIQSKIEKERIQSTVQLLSKLITEKGNTQKLTDQQKKLLKEVLTPEDYIHLENEERRKEEERLEAEELKKNGTVRMP